MKVRRIERDLSRIGTRQATDRNVWLAAVYAHPSRPAYHPTAKFGIEDERLIGESGPGIEFADDEGECVSAPGERHRIILPQGRGMPGQPLGFGSLFRAIHHPAACLALGIAAGRHAVSRGIFRIEFDGPVEQPQSLVVAFPAQRWRAAEPRRK